MRRDTPMVAAILLLCVVLLLIAMTLYQREVRAIGEVELLRSQLAAAQRVEEKRTGGAESAPPPPQTTSSGYTFPIAETDYLTLTSAFGYRVSPILNYERYHEGIDVAATWRAQVVAAADGEVLEHWPAPDGYYRGHDVYGGMIVLEHDNGWRTLYAHLSETRVHTGFRVRAGEVIGRVGNTGRSRGSHLHFEIMDAAGQRQNPLLYVAPKGDL